MSCVSAFSPPQQFQLLLQLLELLKQRLNLDLSAGRGRRESGSLEFLNLGFGERPYDAGNQNPLLLLELFDSLLGDGAEEAGLVDGVEQALGREEALESENVGVPRAPEEVLAGCEDDGRRSGGWRRCGNGR